MKGKWGQRKMLLQLKTIQAAKCPKKDVIAALGIYLKSVDIGSTTDTNQIKDYIWNAKNHRQEKRIMFFYLLYGNDNSVEGFSEFAYLPENQVLVLDYLCTRRRNHVLFYAFYHMVVQEIETMLKKHGNYIRYIITELSLTQENGKLIDTDSNYFRHLLSNENFKLLKYPYYQPPLLPNESAKEFSLAIKLMSSVDNDNLILLEASQYLSIVKEVYYYHYLEWYHNDSKYSETIHELEKRINAEILQSKKCEPISMVQCQLFEEGQCPKFTVENITLARVRKKRWQTAILLATWILLPILVLAFCIIPQLSGITGVACSFLTIIAGIISIISTRNIRFSSK